MVSTQRLRVIILHVLEAFSYTRVHALSDITHDVCVLCACVHACGTCVLFKLWLIYTIYGHYVHTYVCTYIQLHAHICCYVHNVHVYIRT